MSGERFLLDTFFIEALLNPRDSYHERARAFRPRVRDAREVFVTEAVLLESGNGLSASGNRDGFAAFVRQCYQTDNMRVIPMDTLLLLRALSLFEARPDKEWSLVDCVSFVVMTEEGINLAATGDHHFEQAGFVPILAKGNQTL